MHAPCDESTEDEEGPDSYAQFMGLFGDDDRAAAYHINQEEWEAQVLTFRSPFNHLSINP